MSKQKSAKITPARVATILAALSVIGLALVPVIGQADWHTIPGIVAGIAAISGVVAKFLHGNAAWEARQPVPAPAGVSVGSAPGSAASGAYYMAISSPPEPDVPDDEEAASPPPPEIPETAVKPDEPAEPTPLVP